MYCNLLCHLSQFYVNSWYILVFRIPYLQYGFLRSKTRVNVAYDILHRVKKKDHFSIRRRLPVRAIQTIHKRTCTYISETFLTSLSKRERQKERDEKEWRLNRSYSIDIIVPRCISCYRVELNVCICRLKGKK